jgi:hypothetical protein
MSWINHKALILQKQAHRLFTGHDDFGRCVTCCDWRVAAVGLLGDFKDSSAQKTTELILKNT